MIEQNIRIHDIIVALKKRWKLIAGITLVATIVSASISFFLIKPKYQATTKLFIGKESQDYNNSEVQMYQKLIKTYSDIIMTNDLVNSALEKNNINLSSESVLANLKVSNRNDTLIIDLSYVNHDKKIAKDVIESIANEFVYSSPELISNANVKVIEKAKVPSYPISPNKKMNIIIATLLGILGGSGLAIMLEFMDTTFKDKDALESILGIPVIGVIPNTDNRN